jgi:aldehyde dehydrogenase (NAD+)
VGDPLDKNTDIGAINSAEQLARIRELSDYGEAEGANRWQPVCELPERGYWFPPTIFTDVSPAHRIAREEVFGPVLAILPFETEEEAIEIANDTNYGLAAYVQTGDPKRAERVASRLRAGMVHINGGPHRYGSPFGGYKQSGNGREGGQFGLEDFLEVKTIHRPEEAA